MHTHTPPSAWRFERRVAHICSLTTAPKAARIARQLSAASYEAHHPAVPINAFTPGPSYQHPHHPIQQTQHPESIFQQEMGIRWKRSTGALCHQPPSYYFTPKTSRKRAKWHTQGVKTKTFCVTRLGIHNGKHAPMRNWGPTPPKQLKTSRLIFLKQLVFNPHELHNNKKKP